MNVVNDPSLSVPHIQKSWFRTTSLPRPRLDKVVLMFCSLPDFSALTTMTMMVSFGCPE